jgi:hypothetical protein
LNAPTLILCHCFENSLITGWLMSANLPNKECRGTVTVPLLRANVSTISSSW